MTTRRTSLYTVSALCVTAAAFAASALASQSAFDGSLEVNDAPVTFDAAKKQGSYRTVSNFLAGSEEEGVGVPLTCFGHAPIEATFYADPMKVRRNGSFKGGWDSEIKGKFVNAHKAKGTIHSALDVYFGDADDPHRCETDGALPWTVKLD